MSTIPGANGAEGAREAGAARRSGAPEDVRGGGGENGTEVPEGEHGPGIRTDRGGDVGARKPRVQAAPRTDHGSVSPSTSSDSPALRDAIVTLSFEVIGRIGRIAAAQDMSLTQVRMLGILTDRRLRMAELAAMLGTDRSSVSGLIARAERRDLVVREPASEDRRGFTVTLTAEGQRFAAMLAHQVDEELAPFLASLGPDDGGNLTGMLERIVATIQR